VEETAELKSASLLPSELFGVQSQPVILFGDLEQPVLQLPVCEGLSFRPRFFSTITPVIGIADKIFHVHLNEIVMFI
jgi:hypothetical protein